MVEYVVLETHQNGRPMLFQRLFCVKPVRSLHARQGPSLTDFSVDAFRDIQGAAKVR